MLFRSFEAHGEADDDDNDYGHSVINIMGKLAALERLANVDPFDRRLIDADDWLYVVADDHEDRACQERALRIIDKLESAQEAALRTGPEHEPERPALTLVSDRAADDVDAAVRHMLADRLAAMGGRAEDDLAALAAKARVSVEQLTAFRDGSTLPAARRVALQLAIATDSAGAGAG